MSTAPAKKTPQPDAAAAVQVFKWVLEGQSETDIREAMATHFPAADPPAVLAAVMLRLRDTADSDPSVVFGWCVEATRDLYRRMVELGNFDGALRAVKLMGDLIRNVPHRDEEDAGGVGDGTEGDGPAGEGHPRRRVRAEEDPGGDAEPGGVEGRPRSRPAKGKKGPPPVG